MEARQIVLFVIAQIAVLSWLVRRNLIKGQPAGTDYESEGGAR